MPYGNKTLDELYGYAKHIIKYLKDNNYLTLKMEEMYLFLTNKIQIEKPVLLTFDDGYLWKNVNKTI